MCLIDLIEHIAGGDSDAPPIVCFIALIAILTLWVIAYPVAKLWIQNLAYVIRQDRVTIQKGILTKTQQNMPRRLTTDFVFHGLYMT